jgi:hypothetical protein
VIYPKAGIAAGSGHAGLVREYFQDKGGIGAGSRKPRWNELLLQLGSEAAKSQKNIVISSEGLAKPYGSCKDIGAFVRALAPLMSPPSLEVEVLIACREHLSWAGSIYNQRVKSKNSGNSEQRDPDSFLRSVAPELQYASVIRKLRKTGFRITALNYHPSESWFHRYLSYVGFERSQIPGPQSRNASLSLPMLVAKLAANRVLKTEGELRRFARKLRTMNSTDGDSGSIFGPLACAEAEQWFAADRQFLADEFGIEFPTAEICRTGFFLEATGLDEIAVAVKDMGSAGDAILEIAGKYLRR